MVMTLLFLTIAYLSQVECLFCFWDIQKGVVSKPMRPTGTISSAASHSPLNNNMRVAVQKLMSEAHHEHLGVSFFRAKQMWFSCRVFRLEHKKGGTVKKDSPMYCNSESACIAEHASNRGPRA